jgi:hypothetical protein
MGVGCCVRVLRARSQRPGQSRRVRREGCRGSTGWGLYKGPIPIVNSVHAALAALDCEQRPRGQPSRQWGGSRSDGFSRLSTRVPILFLIPAVRRMVVA